MTVTIHLSDEQAANLEKKAAIAGLSLEEWIRTLADTGSPQAQEQPKQLRQRNFVELCEPVRGLAEDIAFSRNPSTSRSLDL